MPISPEQIRELNGHPVAGGAFGLYWMQAAQRAHWNHALEHAIEQANHQGLPLVVLFCLAEYPEANLRHYTFMLEGLVETSRDLEKKGIQMVVRGGAPADLVPEMAAEAAFVVTDEGHLRVQRAWRDEVAARVPCRMVAVETNCIVPVETVSDKDNFTAGTLRPRINRQLPRFLVPLKQRRVRHPSLDAAIEGLKLDDPVKLLANLDLARDVPPVEPGLFHPACSHWNKYIPGSRCRLESVRFYRL
jgi:deoxyribodipyrimidine photo-lyase